MQLDRPQQYDRHMNDPGEGGYSTVRMFPDSAGTVLWFGGPVDYELAGLTPGLVHELRCWDQSRGQAWTPGLGWKSADLASRFTAEGYRLAQCIADELGRGYEIEFTSLEDYVQARRFRGLGPALNLRAAAVFDARTAAMKVEKEVTRASARRVNDHGWLAYSPLSDAAFKPPWAAKE